MNYFVLSEYAFLTLPNGEKELQIVWSENASETEVDNSICNGDGTFEIANFDMPGRITNEIRFNAVVASLM